MSAAATQGQAERAELEAVLGSGIFNRSPSLATFLRFVCERYLDGNTDGLKEYCIAVEALKRPPDFDQKKDAIVRVEAHRLRKRLAEYYQKDGAQHPIHIEIPSGQYAPRFVYRSENEVSGENVAAKEITPLPEEAADPTQGSSKRKMIFWMLAAGCSALALLALTLFFINTSRGDPRNAREVWHGSSTPVPMDFRMLAGYHGLPFTDRQGRVWSPDAFYDGGVSVPLPDHRSFQGVPDPEFAAAQRLGDFEYSIPVNPGTYELHLHFLDAQPEDTNGAGPKLFNVFLNGKLALDHIDPLSDAGAAKRLTSRVLADAEPASDGHLHLKFEQQGAKPELVGLEILATTPGHVRPVRIVAAAHSVSDVEENRWLADQCFVGGTMVERNDIVQESGLRDLYRGERYGNFSYQLALPPGKYKVKLYFAEAYFTDKTPTARIFNVFADGATLLRNFNVMKEAGGPRRAVVKTFENLEPNAQGKIVLEFVPVANYAEVNAIEVTQMN